jgi:hypothetical protein
MSLICVSNLSFLHSVWGRVDRKSDPRKNIVGLNLTPELAPTGEIWHPKPEPVGFWVEFGCLLDFVNMFISEFFSGLGYFRVPFGVF